MYLQAHVSHTGQSLLSDLLNGSHSETIQTPTSLHCSNKLILKDSGMVCKAAIQSISYRFCSSFKCALISEVIVPAIHVTLWPSDSRLYGKHWNRDMHASQEH